MPSRDQRQHRFSQYRFLPKHHSAQLVQDSLRAPGMLGNVVGAHRPSSSHTSSTALAASSTPLTGCPGRVTCFRVCTAACALGDSAVCSRASSHRWSGRWSDCPPGESGGEAPDDRRDCYIVAMSRGKGRGQGPHVLERRAPLARNRWTRRSEPHGTEEQRDESHQRELPRGPSPRRPFAPLQRGRGK